MMLAMKPRDMPSSLILLEDSFIKRRRFQSFIAQLLFAIVLVVTAGCSKHFPDPVESKDGQSWIPIAGTAFLIPEKSWLTGYARNSMDGMVSHISMHAMAPEAQPWSQAIHEQMYPKLGRGQRIDIDVMKTVQPSTFHERFTNFPQSIFGGGSLVEESSDMGEYGLHKFRKRRVTDGQLETDMVFYEYVEDDRVKYYAHCDDDGARRGGVNQCNLMFPYAGKFEVTLSFRRVHMADAVSMAGKIAAKLEEFEMAGQTRLPKRI